MTDIKQAIADLREAINDIRRLECPHCTNKTDITVASFVDDTYDSAKKALAALTALEQAVGGDDLTSRIQAAAEEIFKQADSVIGDAAVEALRTIDIAAIIRKHVEGKEA